MNVQDSIRNLEGELDRKLGEAEQLKRAIASLKGVVMIVSDGAQLPTSDEYAGKGILEAARLLVKEVGKPMTTRDLAEGITQRGWTTRSRNVTATVYATLKNSTKDWRRNASGEWEYIGVR